MQDSSGEWRCSSRSRSAARVQRGLDHRRAARGAALSAFESQGPRLARVLELLSRGTPSEIALTRSTTTADGGEWGDDHSGARRDAGCRGRAERRQSSAAPTVGISTGRRPCAAAVVPSDLRRPARRRHGGRAIAPRSRRHERRRVRLRCSSRCRDGSRRPSRFARYAPARAADRHGGAGLDGVRPSAVGRASPRCAPRWTPCSARWCCAADMSAPVAAQRPVAIPWPRSSGTSPAGNASHGTARAARATRVGGAARESADRDRWSASGDGRRCPARSQWRRRAATPGSRSSTCRLSHVPIRCRSTPTTPAWAGCSGRSAICATTVEIRAFEARPVTEDARPARGAAQRCACR